MSPADRPADPVLEALMDRQPVGPPIGWRHPRAKRWARRSARRKARRVLRETALSLRASLVDRAGHSSIPGGPHRVRSPTCAVCRS
jgi:hypothetical protein